MSDYTSEQAMALEVLLGGLQEHLPNRDGRIPKSEEELLALVDCSKEEAYEARDLLLALLEEQAQSARLTVLEAVVHHCQDHPGAVCVLEGRRVYSEGYLRFVVSLVQPGGPARWLSLAEVAGLCRVPLDEVETWLGRQGRGTP